MKALSIHSEWLIAFFIRQMFSALLKQLYKPEVKRAGKLPQGEGSAS